MARDYRTYLRSVGRKSVTGLKLRTVKKPGDLEIVHVGGGEYEAFRHGDRRDGVRLSEEVMG